MTDYFKPKPDAEDQDVNDRETKRAVLEKGNSSPTKLWEGPFAFVPGRLVSLEGCKMLFALLYCPSYSSVPKSSLPYVYPKTRTHYVLVECPTRTH